MKTVFLTGAEGFTGRLLTPFLKQRNYDVVGGVRNRARKLAYEKQWGRALVCEASDAINVARAIASVKPDVVVHLAGPVGPDAEHDDPLAAYQSIVTGWANILDGVRRVTPRARVVLASSWEVYGGNQTPTVREDTALNPSDAFGSFKANAESVAQTFFQNYHLNVAIARPFCYTGTGQSERGFFGGIASQLSNGRQTVNVPGLGSQRDFLHVQDVIEAYGRIIEADKPNEIYNICSGKTWSVRDLVSKLAGFGRWTGSFQQAEGDEAWQGSYCGDNTKLRQLGWTPTRSIESALQELAHCYAKTPVESAA
ncbi:MAG: GDP-4-dehydro-D-rhamnose reductase [Planctomycetota bacterium]